MMQEVTEVTASLAEIDFLLSEVRVTESSSSMGIPGWRLWTEISAIR